SIEVGRDGEFESLGFVTHTNHRQLGYLEDAKYLSMLLDNASITCVVTSKELAPLIPQRIGLAISEMPRKSFYDVH
ncbi:MAG: UDP-3-O-(3-hydroxymyristoyl)glucosamine N-acyltransferase, partial [Chloroflexota bacterium]|nr:UDP-3-O-(3-hydroxymyristoyl)glucosamine N-acyltransferase [Chloroflexota bacterium]